MSDVPSPLDASVIARTRVALDLAAAELFSHVPAEARGQAPTAMLAHVPQAVLAGVPEDVLGHVLAGPAEWILLEGFAMERQCHTKWCWASAALAVARYYNPDSDCTQDAIAKLIQKNPAYDYDASCYIDPLSKEEDLLPYNTPENLMSILILMGTYGYVHPIPEQAPPLERIQEWIDGDEQGRRPVCVRIVWPDGNGHFVVIAGYRPGTNLLQVWDPLLCGEHKEIPYEKLAQHYSELNGKWWDTVYTKHSTRSCSGDESVSGKSEYRSSDQDKR